MIAVHRVKGIKGLDFQDAYISYTINSTLFLLLTHIDFIVHHIVDKSIGRDNYNIYNSNWSIVYICITIAVMSTDQTKPGHSFKNKFTVGVYKARALVACQIVY